MMIHICKTENISCTMFPDVDQILIFVKTSIVKCKCLSECVSLNRRNCLDCLLNGLYVGLFHTFCV